MRIGLWAVVLLIGSGTSLPLASGQVEVPEPSPTPASESPLPALAENGLEPTPAEDWETAKPEYGNWYAPTRRHYVQADALLWDRVEPNCDRVLAIDMNQFPGDDTLLTTGDLDFDYEPGMRVTLGWLPDPCRGCNWCSAWELGYLGIFESDSTVTVTGDNNVGVPGDLGLAVNPFGNGDEVTADYDWQLHGIELNCVKSCCFDCRTRLDVLCGFRFLTLQEDFSLIGIDANDGPLASYDISADNYLYGVQVGGRLRRAMRHCSVEVLGKAGIFLNDAQQRQSVSGFPFPPGEFYRDPIGSDGQSAAMVAEIGVTLVRPISDVWSLRAGYSALGVGGVALAVNQVDFTDTFTSGQLLCTDGWLLLHGAHLGLEASW